MPEVREKVVMPDNMQVSLLLFHVSQYYQVTIEDMMCIKKRARDVSLARHMAWYLMVKLIDLTQRQITAYFGRMERSNVSYAINHVKDLMDVYPSVRYDEMLLSKLIENAIKN